MKYITLTLLFIGSALVTSCTSTPAEKVADANENVSEARKDLETAQADSAAEYAKFKEESEAKLRANEIKLAELKAGLKSENAATRAEYEKDIAALNEKNITLRMRMNDFKLDAIDSWSEFKKDFNEEMDELGKSISAQAEKNKNK